ncbi:hypothetical protein [Salinibacterium sp.]|uniref:hypothetical protein n=1 Tax=Salinibacterium sp. TaxID=1915057 RepID=UPI00286ACFBB|nr:hypothetical protein [Salinibacterium sp.]
MNLADTLRGLLRRWYIVIPGLLIAAILAIFASTTIKPDFERTATQLLLPGQGTIPEGATNPYLFLGGLTQSADVLVRSLNADEAAGEVVQDYPGTEITASKDPSTSGPIILITVTAKSNADAKGALTDILLRSAVILERLQSEQNVKVVDRITISTLTEDQSSTLQQRNRLVATVGVGVGIAVITILLASLVDGLSRRTRAGQTEGTLIESDVEAEDVPEDSDTPADPDTPRKQPLITSDADERGRRSVGPRLFRSGRSRVAGRDRAGVGLSRKRDASTSRKLPESTDEAPAG